MADAYLPPVRSHLKLCHKLLTIRLAAVTNQPPGLLQRNNQITHTQAMLGLLSVLRGMANHDPLDWWDEKEDVPF